MNLNILYPNPAGAFFPLKKVPKNTEMLQNVITEMWHFKISSSQKKGPNFVTFEFDPCSFEPCHLRDTEKKIAATDSGCIQIQNEPKFNYRLKVLQANSDKALLKQLYFLLFYELNLMRFFYSFGMQLILVAFISLLCS